MKRFQTPILALVALVLIAATGFAAIRSASSLWTNVCRTLTFSILLGATVSARFARGRAKAFWFGFAAFGLGFFWLEAAGMSQRIAFSSGFSGVLSISGQDEPGGKRETQLRNSRTMLSFCAGLLATELRHPQDDPRLIAIATRNTLEILTLHFVLAAALAGGLLSYALVSLRKRAQPGPTTQRAIPTGLFLIALALFLPALVVTCIERFSSTGGSAPRAYFPPIRSPEDGDKENDVFLARFLESAREPVLSPHQGKEVFRVLWLPCFHYPVCVSAERSNGAAKLRTVVLDGRGGYGPGRIAIDRTVSISQASWDELARRLDSAGFWRTPRDLDRSPNPDEDESFADGDRLVIEGIRNNEHHVTETYAPPSDLESCIAFLFDLSPIDLTSVWNPTDAMNRPHPKQRRIIPR